MTIIPITEFYYSVSEAPSLSDSSGKSYRGFRAPAESPVTSDSSDKFFQGSRSESDDISFSLADTITRGWIRALSETPPISDAFATVFTGFRAQQFTVLNQ